MSELIEFETQLEAELVGKLQAIAQRDGQPLQAILEEALTDLLEKRRRAQVRPHVMAAYEASIERFGPLYDFLAK